MPNSKTQKASPSSQKPSTGNSKAGGSKPGPKPMGAVQNLDQPVK